MKFLNESKERSAIRSATVHYKRALLNKCFRALNFYSVYRRKKKLKKQKIDEYAESQLVYRVYKTWFQKYEIVKENFAINETVDIFKERFLKYRAFHLWKDCT